MTDLVHVQVEHPDGQRNRLTTAFRPILAIPHAILVGGPLVGFHPQRAGTGVLGVLALTCALIDWFAILFTGRSIEGLRQFKRLYLGWRARFLAYAWLLRDEYPPFGDGPYPTRVELPDEPEPRDRWAVGLRIFLLLPHLLVLFCLFVVQILIWIVAWFSIVFTRRLADRLWRFTRDVVHYTLRVESYALLIHDRFPSFSLSAEPAPPQTVEKVA
jgi:Domain of unknown function (DUF4389)